MWNVFGSDGKVLRAKSLPVCVCCKESKWYVYLLVVTCGGACWLLQLLLLLLSSDAA